MKNLIINRINQIRSEEDDFNQWKDAYVSYKINDFETTKHLSLIDFKILNNKDLCRVFEFIILRRN